MTKIESATLRLYNNDISGKQGFHIGIHTVKVNWEEGTNNDKFSVAMALPGELTWSNQPTFSPDPIMILNVGSYAGKWVDVDITPIAKIWKSKANHGLVLSPLDAIKGTSCSFSSKEYRSTEKRPHLILRGLNGSQVLVKNNL